MEDMLRLRELYPTLLCDRQLLSDFLERHALRYEQDIEFAIGAFDSENNLCACGCCAGRLLKCFAVTPQLRGQNVLGRILSALVTNRFAAGFFDLTVFTRPHNRALFAQSGFVAVAETESVVLMENRHDGVARFVASIAGEDASPQPCGAVVMNCNPFTLGHRYLIEYAAARCNLLHLFLVQEDRSVFPFDIRLALVRSGVADLANVQVHPSGHYIISSDTFPTYFLKQQDDAVAMQAELDLMLFATRIASPLGIVRRFVGSEPGCPVTARYNEVMHRILPAHGIEVVELARRTEADVAISASALRGLLAQGILDERLEALAPPVTCDFLRSQAATPILAALRQKGGRFRAL